MSHQPKRETMPDKPLKTDDALASEKETISSSGHCEPPQDDREPIPGEACEAK